jgi:hypothetical protein
VRIQDDPEPQWDILTRSDQYGLIRRGVPAVTFKVGYENGLTRIQVAKTDADKSYASRFDGVVLGLAMTVANQAKRPQWLATSYFKRFSR